MKQLDIGCSGFTRTWEGYECFGVDVQDHSKEPNTSHIKRADLVIEQIPFKDNEFDLVTAYDFLEHVPQVIYYTDFIGTREKNIYGISLDSEIRQRITRRQVMIELFNEVYRVLNNGGLFYSQTPIYPDKTIFQDPTHLSVWTDDSMNYFSGDYFGWHDHYGHTSRFEQINKKIENNHLMVTLKSIKDVANDVPYKLRY